MNKILNLKKFFLVIVVALVAVIIAGCDTTNKAEDLITKVHLPGIDDVRGSFPVYKYVEGNTEAPITWESSNEDIVSVDEYPSWDDSHNSNLFYKATVVLPEEQTVVTLKATVTYEGKTAIKEFDLTVRADTYAEMTIAQAKQADLNTAVKLEGTVVVDLGDGFIMQDDTGYIFLFRTSTSRNVGDQVVVRGTMTVFNNMPQLARGSTSEKVGEEDAGYDPFAGMDFTDLSDIITHDVNDKNFYSSLFKVKGLITSEPNNVHNPYFICNPFDLDEKIGITQYTSADSRDELKAMFPEDDEEEVEDIYVEAYIAIYSSYAGEYSVVFIENRAKELDLNYTDQDKANLSLQKMTNSLKEVVVTGDIELPEFDETYDANIEWTSSHPEILANDGTVTAPDEDTVVTLTIKTEVNGKTAEGTIEVTVRKLEVSKVNSILPLTPDNTEDRILVLIEGVVVGHQFQGYWVADETGAILVFQGHNNDRPEIGTVVQVKGNLATHQPDVAFVSQIRPIEWVELTDAVAPNVIAPVEMSMEDIFALNVDSYEKSKEVGLDWYGKFITITGTAKGSGHFWTVVGDNPDQWFRLNSLGSNAGLVDGQEIEVTVMVRDIYFVDDPGNFNNFKAGTFGGVYFIVDEVNPISVLD